MSEFPASFDVVTRDARRTIEHTLRAVVAVMLTCHVASRLVGPAREVR